MTTALDLITDALMEIGVVSTGEPVQPEDSTISLRKFNALLSSWSTQSLTVFAQQTDAYTLVPGQATYTVGPSGNFNGGRPGGLASVIVTYQGIDFEPKSVDNDQYDAIALKTLPNILPAFYQYEPTMPLGRLTFWPVPTQALPVKLRSDQKLATLATLTTALSFPDGYERALRLNLAIELAQAYGRQVGPQTLGLAAAALADIKRANKRSPVVRLEVAGFSLPNSSVNTLQGN